MPFYFLFSRLKSLFNQSQFRSRSVFLKTLVRFLCPFQALLYLFLDGETRTAHSNQEVNAQQNDYFVFCIFPSNFWQSICFLEHCSAVSQHLLELLTATLSSLPWVVRGSLKPIFNVVQSGLFFPLCIILCLLTQNAGCHFTAMPLGIMRFFHVFKSRYLFFLSQITQLKKHPAHCSLAHFPDHLYTRRHRS